MKYPGIHFTPPKDSVDPDDTEGEALVQWRKIGDRYTIVAFEGEPLGEVAEEVEEDGGDSMAQLEAMYPNPGA